MASGPDGYSTGLVWDNKPNEVPTDAYVVRIEDAKPIPNSWVFTARVIEGPAKMVGRRFRFQAMNWNSCVGHGAIAGYALVSDGVGWASLGGEAKQVLELIDYAPTFMNEVLRLVFGGSQWRYPGEPSERQVLVP